MWVRSSSFVFLMFRDAAAYTYRTSLMGGWVVTLVVEHLDGVGSFTIDLCF